MMNSTILTGQTKTVKNPAENVFWLFRISFMLYSVIGFIVAMVVGQVVSWLTGGSSQPIDENLLIPFFQSNEFKQRMKRRENDTRYTTVDQMLIEMTKIDSKHGINQHDDNDDDDDDEAIVYGVNGKPTPN